MAPPVLGRLAAVPGRLAAAARAAPADGPAPGAWTPTDVVRHLIAVELEVWHPRLAQLRVEDHPIWPWVEPDRWTAEPDAGLDRLLEVYERERGVTLARLGALDDAGWARTGPTRRSACSTWPPSWSGRSTTTTSTSRASRPGPTRVS
jgi:hypothetical protein